MLASQRALFDIPRDVCYLNAASYSPLPLAVQEAGRIGVGRKGQPWTLDPGFASQVHERTRRAAAALINAAPDDIALVPSVAYGVATAGKQIRIPPGQRVLVLQDDHSSPVLEWMTRAADGGFTLDIVRQPGDGDWTQAVLDAIARPGAPPVALASMSSIHWSDGGALDLARIAPPLRAQGAALLVDATHGVGVMPVDVRTLDPDFLLFPTYKWVLGPYGRAFLYVAKRRQDGVPLEQTSHGRRAIAAEGTPYMKDTAYAAGARRFDMGERDHFISMEMAALGMEMMAGWGQAVIAGRLGMLTARLAAGLGAVGNTRLPDPLLRAPHILSVAFPAGMPPGLIERLAAANVHVAPRLGRVRISPHVYNDEDDIERCVSAFRRLMG
ncbi:aminotransferase class V-fold PLP-dependent enzyme [Vineibacter terrae]|uniref:aminotransferase class V-fold PLP-dependent enzyme n=1 Tax=Vineibacter terrae TaxID=2586908 RepID=UPI002E364C20|nr:aminotransferase class V-fold PLP-dependent enzyme [Vineibacter terrae]HEX2886008.1 aminotransferase class V-fold PLP-dependent enzyme [Vineibacter terrae]